MSNQLRANYALVDFGEHLGAADDRLDVPWATFVGDESSEREFFVPTDDPVDAYLELQVYDIGVYDHEVRINGESSAGFDIPPLNGWQYWMDPLDESMLQEGQNTIQIRRCTDNLDEFVVGTVTVHWCEPVG